MKKPIKLLVLRGNFVNLMLFALLGAPVSPGYAESKAEITTVLEAPGALTNRLLLEREDLRLYFLDRRDPREPDRKEATAGVAAPFFVAGPVEPLGLFRETENPLGYGDASDVFGERTGLGLAANLEVSPRHGVWIQAPRRGFGLGGYGKARDGARFAAASSLEIPGSLEVSGLLQIARPDSAPPAEDWFPEKPSYPGGTLYNLALRLFCPFTLPLAGAARFSLSLGSSRGDRLERGSFLHASASQESGLLKSSFLLGFCEPRYATPSGTFPTGRILGSGTAALLPEALVSPKLRASIKEERQRPLPIPRPPRDEEYGGGVTVKTKTLTVTAEGDYGRSWDEKNERSDRTGMELDGIFRDDFFRLEARAAVLRESGGLLVTSVLEGEVFPAAWDAGGRLKITWGRVPAFAGSVSVARKGRAWRFGLSAELTRDLEATEAGRGDFLLSPFKYLTLSLFWTARETF